MDPDATLDGAPDGDDAPQDTAQDTQSSGQVDWELKYREAQKLIARQGQELGIYRKQGAQPDPEPAPEPVQPSGDRLVKDSWRLAETIYGEDAVQAFGKAQTVLDKAETPADVIAAFEAYHQMRSGAAQQGARQEEQGSPQQQPRIESNRPDVSPQTSTNREIEAAAAKGDLRGYLAASIRAIRGE